VASINRFPHIVQTGSSEYDEGCAHQAGQGEEPQEEPVQHHGHVLPILHHLKIMNASVFLTHKIPLEYLIVFIIVSDMLGNKLNTQKSMFHFRAELLRHGVRE
jgi:hypothetical protein